MLSANDKKYLDLIESLVNLCLKKLSDIYFILSTFSELLQVYNKIEDSGLRYNLETKGKEILVSRDPIKFKKYLDELSVIISTAKKQQKTYLDVDKNNIVKTDNYKKDCSKFKSIKELIEETESKILNSPVFQRKLHEDLDYPLRFAGHLHARINQSLRIIYTYSREERKIVFKSIISHDEM